MTLSFEARVSSEEANALVGLAAGATEAFTDLSAIVRFSESGELEARDGDSYGAVTAYSYEPDRWYRFEIDIDVSAGTYDVDVRACGDDSATQLATGAAFRSETTGRTVVSSVELWTSGAARLDVANVRWEADACEAQTCEGLGADCGMRTDPCTGATLDCGDCPDRELCVERPGPSNTGPLVPEDELEAYTGPSTITTDGTLIEGVVIRGQLNIEASNVTIRNFALHSGGWFGIQVVSGTNLVIEDGSIEGMKADGIIGSNFTARRLEIHNAGGDAIKGVRNFVIEGCWLHHLGYEPDSHADGLQMLHGGDALVRCTFFDMPVGRPGYNNSQCVHISTYFAGVDDVRFERNYFNGGGYCVQVRSSDNGTPTNVWLIANRFGRDFRYGPWILEGGPVTDRNVWDDTGALMEGQTGGSGSTLEPPPP